MHVSLFQQMFSYARNSCSRNHRRYTKCAYHWGEDHGQSEEDRKASREAEAKEEESKEEEKEKAYVARMQAEGKALEEKKKQWQAREDARRAEEAQRKERGDDDP